MAKMGESYLRLSLVIVYHFSLFQRENPMDDLAYVGSWPSYSSSNEVYFTK